PSSVWLTGSMPQSPVRMSGWTTNLLSREAHVTQMTLPTLSPTSAALVPADLPHAVAEGLYVHVPFCFHKCHYCDFYSITRQSEQRMRHFVELLLGEARQWARADSKVRVVPKTVFFGGGTPSLLPLEYMSRLIQGLGKTFDLSEVAEWTVEVNPATAS